MTIENKLKNLEAKIAETQNRPCRLCKEVLYGRYDIDRKGEFLLIGPAEPKGNAKTSKFSNKWYPDKQKGRCPQCGKEAIMFVAPAYMFDPRAFNDSESESEKTL